jgi:DNA-binding PucR family transcriptional regulator
VADLDRLLQPHIAAMWADRDRLVQQVAHAVTSGVPSYLTTPSSEVWIGMTRILDRAVHGNPFADPTEDDRLAALGTGAQGAGAGIAADDLVSAVLLGARAVESDVLARAGAAGVPADDLLEASRRFRQWAEQAAVWALQGLLGAQATEPSRHAREARLMAELAAGDEVAGRRSMAELGFDPALAWYAVAVAGPSGVPAGAAATLRLAQVGAVWGEPPASADDAEFLGLVRERPRVPGGLVAGMSGPALADNLVSALRESVRAARIGRRFGRSGIVTLSDLGLLVPVHEDPALARRLVERWIEPLHAETRHDLLTTLRSWLENGGQVDAVARECAVHANTIRNRLDRVAVLLGDDWRSPQHRAELWAALQVEGAKLVESST